MYMSDSVDKKQLSKVMGRFANIATFLRADYSPDLEGVDIGLIGVPFDGGASNRVGTRHAPRYVRDQSTYIDHYNCQTKISPFNLARILDLGDVPILNRAFVDESLKEIYQAYKNEIIERGIFPATIGGDHSISYPIVRAIAEKYGTVALVHFDAHCDTVPDDGSIMGTRFHHGSPFYNLVQEGFVDPKKTIQVGLRGIGGLMTESSYKLGMTVLHMHEVYELGINNVIKRIRELIGDTICYLTFDIDAVDVAYAPGAGTPEIGGFTSYEVQQVLRGMTGMNIIGSDLVEISPPFDLGTQTSFLGANLYFEQVCLMAHAFDLRKKGKLSLK